MPLWNLSITNVRVCPSKRLMRVGGAVRQAIQMTRCWYIPMLPGRNVRRERWFLLREDGMMPEIITSTLWTPLIPSDWCRRFMPAFLTILSVNGWTSRKAETTRPICWTRCTITWNGCWPCKTLPTEESTTSWLPLRSRDSSSLRSASSPVMWFRNQ